MRKNLALGLTTALLCLAVLAMFQPALRAPAGGSGTPSQAYVPLMALQIPDTLTPTATATATSTLTEAPPASSTNTATPTATATTPAPASLHITTLSGDTMPEQVIIANTGGGAQDMTGWKLVSVVGPQTYNFPASYVLGAGQQVSVQSYNGAGNNPPTVLFWTSAAVWANGGDKAELRNASNGLVDSACYASGCP